jgi:hypothetical protein
MDLRWIAESTLDKAQTEPAKPFPQHKKFWAAGLAALAVGFVTLAGLGGYRRAKSAETPMSIHAEIPPPDKFSLDTTGDAGGMPVLSRQDDKIAFVAHSGETKMLWVRSLKNDAAQALDGTAGATHPFFPGWQLYRFLRRR